ncbi:MAG: protein kinase, partial [Clostridia bacterium]|nr:protein kinase [Clostridia bacterium]
MIGKVIGNRYEIIEKVGTGGMATVYKAKCQVLDRFVAIKVLKDSLKHDIEVVKKFNTESRAAARLSHPNIVQVYDVSESGDIDYIVMEHVDGITLKEYI